MEVFMETEEVEDLARRFSEIAEVLRVVAKVMETLMNIIRTNAFIGLVGGFIVERYLATLKPKIENMATYMDEISRDLKTAVKLYINGDKEGASRFY